MRYILCDRCKKIMEDERKMRVVTCAKPLVRKPPEVPSAACYGDDRRMNDVIWTKELCADCAEDYGACRGTGTGEPSEPSD